MHTVPLILLSIYIGKSLECDEHIHKNITCNDIKRDDGYQYLYNGSKANEVFVNSNEMHLAHAVIKKQSFEISLEVIHMDNNSVTTRDCRDLHIKSVVNYGMRFVKEICVDYKIIAEREPFEPLQGTSAGLIGGVFFGVIAFIFTAILILLCFLSWKRELMKHQGAATVPSFWRYLLACACFRKRIPQPQAGSEGTGLGEMPSEADPRGSGEEDRRDDALEGVTVDSIDPLADGAIHESLSLDHNLNNGGIQPSKNGEIRTPEVRASDLQAMNRNQRDDPGGVRDNKGKNTVWSREMSNGWAHPNDHETEGQPLLSIQRAGMKPFDMTGEATVLVNKHRFDRDRISRCSTAPDADVESTSNMNNCAHSG